jgi:phasin
MRHYADEGSIMTDEALRIATTNLRKGAAAAEDTEKAFAEAFSFSADGLRDYHLKMIELARANSEAVFDLGRNLATARSPSDVMQLWTEFARRQIETLTEQTQQMVSLFQQAGLKASQPMSK